MHFINFSLLNPKSKTESLITVYVTIDGERVRLSTKQRIHPKMWDAKRKGITTSNAKIDWYIKNGLGSEVYLKSIQTSLNQLRAEIDSFLLSHNYHDNTTALQHLKNHLQEFLNGTSKISKDKSSISDFLSLIIEEMQSGNRKKTNGKPYTPSTIECYNTLLQILGKFELATKTKLKWVSINRNFYQKFVDWNQKRGVSLNYIGRLIKDLKSVMRTGYEENIHTSDEFRKRYFSVPKEAKKKVPLTLSEIQRLQNLQIEYPNSLALSRDIFVLGCYIGLRISDLKRISSNHIQKNKDGYFIAIKTQKTGIEVKIPLNKIAVAILQRYNYKFPPISEQVINRNLKTLGKMIGLSHSRSKSLSIHYARHSFARLAYQQGVPSMYIMKVTGHQSEKSFLNYINISQDEAMYQFRKVELFQ